MGFPCGSAGKESTCNEQDLGSNPWAGKIPWRMERLTTPVFWPGEFHGLYIFHALYIFPGSGRSPGEGNDNPLQYSCLENPMDGGAWWATLLRVAKSGTRLSD